MIYVQCTKFIFVSAHFACCCTFFVCLNTTIEDYWRVVKTCENSIKIVLKVTVQGLIMNVKKIMLTYTCLLTTKSGSGLGMKLLTDLFIIRKLVWTSVICDNTGPPGRVCINVMYGQCCLKHLDPQFWNKFWMQRSCQMLIEPLIWEIFTDLEWSTKAANMKWYLPVYNEVH